MRSSIAVTLVIERILICLIESGQISAHSITSRNETDASLASIKTEWDNSIEPTLKTTLPHTTTPSAGLETTLMYGVTTKKSKNRRRKGSRRKDRKNDFMLQMSAEERKNLIIDVIQEIEDSKIHCDWRDGRFYDYSKNTCEQCIELCESEWNLELCGAECRDFFENELRKVKMSQNSMVSYVVIVLLIIAIFIFVKLLISNRKLKKSDKNLSKEMKLINDRLGGTAVSDRDAQEQEHEGEGPDQDGFFKIHNKADFDHKKTGVKISPAFFTPN